PPTIQLADDALREALRIAARGKDDSLIERASVEHSDSRLRRAHDVSHFPVDKTFQLSARIRTNTSPVELPAGNFATLLFALAELGDLLIGDHGASLVDLIRRADVLWHGAAGRRPVHRA